MELAVLVINRDQDVERLRSFAGSAEARGLDYRRISACDGHRPDFPFAMYAPLIGDHFWGDALAKPGAIACFLSHRRAWQCLVDEGLPAALICEDDAVFAADGPSEQDLAAAMAGTDLLFVNGRMAAWATASGATASGATASGVTASGVTAPLSVADVIAALAAAGGPKAMGVKPTPGGDAYVLSHAGAARLLDLTAAQRIVCGVDWAMVWNCLSTCNIATGVAFPELGVLARHLTLSEPPLTAKILPTPLASQSGDSPSTLKHAIKRPLQDLTRRGTTLTHAEYVTTMSLGGVDLHFAGRSGPDPVMEHHRNGEIWDEAGLRLLLPRFPEGGTFVDIGAHLGNHAVFMGRLGAAATLLLAEANDEVTRLLRTNLMLNGLGARAELAPPGTAIWSSQGSGWLLRNRRKSSETMVKADIPEDQREGAKPMRLITGDDWLGTRPVHAIKIDTSGSEPEVLRGLTATLQASRPMLLIDHASGQVERISRLGAERGYGVVETVASSRQNRASSLLVWRSGAAR